LREAASIGDQHLIYRPSGLTVEYRGLGLGELLLEFEVAGQFAHADEHIDRLPTFHPGGTPYPVAGALIGVSGIRIGSSDPGCERITADRDFARFEGLRWRIPV